MQKQLAKLNEHYAEYRHSTPAERKAIDEKNASVMACIRQTRPDIACNLRTLWIHQLFHQEQLRRPNLSDEEKETLYGNLMATRGFIREQTELGEQIVPDPIVEATANECIQNPKLLLTALGRWVDDDKRSMFLAKLQYDCQKYGAEDWLLQVMKSCLQACSTLTSVHSLETFERLFNMMECTLRVVEG